MKRQRSALKLEEKEEVEGGENTPDKSHSAQTNRSYETRRVVAEAAASIWATFKRQRTKIAAFHFQCQTQIFPGKEREEGVKEESLGDVVSGVGGWKNHILKTQNSDLKFCLVLSLTFKSIQLDFGTIYDSL